MNKILIKTLIECAEHHEQYAQGTLNALEALTGTLKTSRISEDKKFYTLYTKLQKQLAEEHKRYAKAIRTVLKGEKK